MGEHRIFDGKIVNTIIDKDLGIVTSSSRKPISIKDTYLSSLLPGKTVSNTQEQCFTTTFYYEVPYKCGSGNHWPGDPNCTLSGGGAAGVTTITSEATFCYPMGGGGGGSETTPSLPGDYDPCDEPSGDPSAPGVPQTTFCDELPKPTEDEVLEAIEENPFALISNVPCDLLKNWLSTAKFIPDQSILNELTTLANAAGNQSLLLKKVYIQKIDDASSTIINMDNYSVKVNELPIVNGQRLSPGQFLNFIRLNMNNFTDGTKTFNPYNNYGLDYTSQWISSTPKGSILALDIAGPDNASVITSYSAEDRWTFTTIHEPMYGDHPVSGNRNFGYTSNPDGSYTFYTKGVDRLTDWTGRLMESMFSIPFDQTDKLWTSFQSKINSYVLTHGGSAVILTPQNYRPKWNLVQEVLSGRQPLSTLSKKCPPDAYVQ